MKSKINSLCWLIIILLTGPIAYSQDTLILQPGSTQGKDAFIWNLTNQRGRFGPTRITNYGKVKQFIAHEWTWDGSVGTRKSLIDFDFSSLPTGANVISARLSLYSYPNSADGGHASLTGSNESLLQRITSAWEEDLVTWNNQPSATTQNQVKLSRSTAFDEDYLDINVTNLVKDMLSNPANAHGFMLSMQTQRHYRRLIFASSDHPDPTKHPKLVIVYSLDCSWYDKLVDLGKDQNLCEGETTTLDATLAGASYRWQDGTTTAQYKVTKPGTYWVEVTKNRCVIKDTIQINYTLLPINLGKDQTLCAGETTTLDATLAGATYRWQDGATTAQYVVSKPGIYWVEVLKNGCMVKDTVEVNYTPLPVVNLGQDQTLCEGVSTTLDATLTGATYRWQDGATTAQYIVTQPGTYWVDVLRNGCGARDSVVVITKKCNVALTFPNLITPNGDGKNDAFTPIIKEGIVALEIEVYNRWGTKVFAGNNASELWDGTTNNGEKVKQGMYYWIIRYEDILQKTNKITGWVKVLY